MPELKDAITYVEIVIVTLAVLVIGDYLGYKIGRWRLATIAGGIALLTILAFVVYAAVRLA